MNQNDFIKCLTKVSLSEQQKREMLDAILSNRAHMPNKVKRTVRRRLSATAIAVIAVFILTATTALAIHFGWHEKLLEYFHPTQEQIDMLEPATNRADVRTTQAGVTVSVQQTLTDSKGIYVLYEIRLPEGIETPDAVQWRFSSFSVHTKDHPDGASLGFQNSKILGQDGNVITMLYHSKQNDPFAEGRATMELNDLILTQDEIPVYTIEGRWLLEWDFQYDDSIIKTMHINRQAEIGGGTLAIKDIIISPMSVCILAEGDFTLLWENTLLIYFKDGRTFDYNENISENSFMSAEYQENETIADIELYYRFDNLIDWNNINYIEVGDSRIPIA